MRAFVTGASGFIGQAVVRELIAAGHSVLGLARSDVSAATISAAGADVQRGDLNDGASLAAGARACDGVVHLGFIHDFANYAAAAETDRQAIATMLDALADSGKPFIGTTGTALVAGLPLATESDVSSAGPAAARAQAEQMVLAGAERGVRASVIRLPPTVHDAGDHGFIPALIAAARKAGVAPYVGEGANRWPAVHRRDAARLYRLAFERALPGTRLHGVGEEGVAMKAIAETIAQGLGVPAKSVDAAEAGAILGWLAGFAALDNPTSSARTRAAFGWDPKEPDLLSDISANYF